MIRLPETTLNFNCQLKLSNDGGQLYSDTKNSGYLTPIEYGNQVA